LLELAKELQNVSRAGRTLGYSRQQFCEIRRDFQTFGMDGLIGKLPGAKGPHPNRVAREIEDRILKEALERFSPEFRERPIESKHTGDLVAVDTLDLSNAFTGPCRMSASASWAELNGMNPSKKCRPTWTSTFTITTTNGPIRAAI